MLESTVLPGEELGGFCQEQQGNRKEQRLLSPFPSFSLAAPNRE